ncbi:MAG: glycoside hydrolase [Halobacteriales archaeon]|nr:glycoside hydrolase [Halobacteriales archaeon]
MRLIATLLLLVVLAGCTSPPPAQPSLPTPEPRFAADDVRVPVGAVATTDDVGDALPFPLFSPAVNMTAKSSHRETSLAISPADERILFACDPSGVPNPAPPLGQGHSYYYLSKDNGTTWEDIDIESGATDLRRATFEGGDCDVATDAAGTLYSADSWLGEIAIGASKDSGKTWQVGNPLGGYASIADRPWLVCGPAGTLYMSYQDLQFGMPSAIWFVKSTDYALHFSPPVPAVTADPTGAYTWEGNYAVSADGNDIYLVYTRQAGAQHKIGGAAETVGIAASHDGGTTWTQHKVSDRPDSASYLYPSIAMDAGGILHVVFSQQAGASQPIFYSSSKDQGATWTEPVPLLNGTYGVSPWIAAGAKGQAIAVWFGSPDPKAPTAKSADYYLYWARITGADTNATVQVAATTEKPLFHGKNTLGFAEFNMVRLDLKGHARIGASIPAGKGSTQHWQAIYEMQAEGPST